MAKLGRPVGEPKEKWKCSIPVEIAAKIDLLCWDPVRNVTSYGKRSELVTQLLREHLRSLGVEIS
jgi:hypothetical protein